MAIKINNTTVVDDTRNIYNTARVGVGTTSITDVNLVGAGNSMNGVYICNGMVIHDNTLTGNHYIGTAYNGLMAGPVTITGTLTINGNFAVV